MRLIPRKDPPTGSATMPASAVGATLLLRRRQHAAQRGEILRSQFRAERARNLHPQLHHAQVPLRLIVREQHPGIVQEAQRLRLVVGRMHVSIQPPELRVALQVVPAPARASGRGRSRPSAATASRSPRQGFKGRAGLTA